MNWTTKDGESFPIHMMSDTHLNNAILLMRRNGWITTHEAGDMPAYGSDAERIAWASKPASLKLDALAAERLQRIESGVSISEPEAMRMRAQHGRRAGLKTYAEHRAEQAWEDRHGWTAQRQARLASNARATRYGASPQAQEYFANGRREHRKQQLTHAYMSGARPPPYFNEPDDDWHHDDIAF